MITGIKTTMIVGMVAFAVGATSAWWTTSGYKDAKFDAFKFAADAAYAQAKAKTVEIELKNQMLAKELDSAYRQNKRDIDRLSNELATVRMRDPNARSCPVSNPPTTGEPQNEAAGADISEELTQLLRAESRRADEAALYAQTCYRWIRDVQTQ
jgi:hypothetical protein